MVSSEPEMTGISKSGDQRRKLLMLGKFFTLSPAEDCYQLAYLSGSLGVHPETHKSEQTIC